MAVTKECTKPSPAWSSLARTWDKPVAQLRQPDLGPQNVEGRGESDSALSMLWFGVANSAAEVRADLSVETLPIFDQAGIGMAVLDNSFLMVRANEVLAHLLNARPRDLEKCSLTEFTHPEDLESDVLKQGALLNRKIRSYSVVKRLLRTDGGIRWVKLTYSSLQSGTTNTGFLLCADDVTSAMATEQALQDTVSKYKMLVQSSRDGIYILTNSGRFLEVNPALLEMFGYTRSELASLSAQDLLVNPDDYGKCAENMKRDGFVNGFEVQMKRKNGSILECSISASVCRSETGDVWGTQGIVHDITRLKKVERLKDEFISIASHELRTPLTSLRGGLKLLASGKIGVQAQSDKLIQIASENAERLVRLVNDILDIQSLDSGKLTMDLAPCTATDIIEVCLDAMRNLASQQGVELLANAANVEFIADPYRLVQVLNNLISNAVKFSPFGAKILVRAVAKDGYVRFSVTDHGRGIPADKLDTLFQRFQQVDASDRRDKGGTGLGLAISKSIVEQHGGRIWVESVEGQGSTFSFELPIKK